MQRHVGLHDEHMNAFTRNLSAVDALNAPPALQRCLLGHPVLFTLDFVPSALALA